MGTLRCTVPAFVVVVLGLAAAAAAQPGERFEVAANLNLLRVSDFGSTNAGVGGRLSVNLTSGIALEGEVGFFPNDRLTSPATTLGDDTLYVASDRSRTDVLFGVKAGRHNERWGVFGKARPGITRLTDKGSRCIGNGCARALMLIARNTYRTEFAFDFGGGVEIYPSARTVARVELGDTFIRHRSTALPCPASACTSHNLSSRIGIGYRF